MVVTLSSMGRSSSHGALTGMFSVLFTTLIWRANSVILRYALFNKHSALLYMLYIPSTIIYQQSNLFRRPSLNLMPLRRNTPRTMPLPIRIPIRHPLPRIPRPIHLLIRTTHIQRIRRSPRRLRLLLHPLQLALRRRPARIIRRAVLRDFTICTGLCALVALGVQHRAVEVFAATEAGVFLGCVEGGVGAELDGCTCGWGGLDERCSQLG